MKIRRQTYSLDQYLMLMKDETIRSDQECQRLSGQWNQNMMNELIFTVLTGNYMPPVILGEETADGITKDYIIDGLQRSSTLLMFRYGNTRITKNLDEHMVPYQRKVMDEDGSVRRDEKGEIIWESAECNICNKTYSQLPEELKIKFNGYQVETAIHQDCDITELSRLVRRYNNHTAMNSSQKAFTYIDVFAREIREITGNRFFLDVYTCSRNDRKNGTLERIAGDMVLLCNYPEQYRKDTKQGFKWLNENGTIADFDGMNDMLTRLAACMKDTPEIRALFNSKHAHIFAAVFKEFTGSGHEDTEYGKFLEWFVNGGNRTEIDGKTWEMWEADKATRDAGVVHGKIGYLTALVKRYFEKTEKAA